MSKKKQKPIPTFDKKNIITPAPAQKKTRPPVLPKNIPFFWREHFLPLFLLCVLSFCLYLPSVKYEYVLDDKMVITDNTFTQRGISGIGDIFGYESFRGYFGEKKNYLEGDRYRPFSIATFAVEQSLLGVTTPTEKLDVEAQKKLQTQKQEAEKTLRPFRHSINAILYALTAFLMYRVLCLMFASTHDKEKKQWWQTMPFWATLLFVVHPLHVEVVANIKGRDEILAMLGELAALYFSFRYIDTGRAKYLLFSLLAFLVGILSKESAITFLAIVPLSVYFFRRDASKDAKHRVSATTLLTVTAPIALSTFIYLMMRVNAIGYLMDDKVVTEIMNNPFANMDFGEKYATIFYTLFMYLKLLVIPHPLTHDYYPYQIPKSNWSQVIPVVSLIIHLGLVYLVYRGWKNRRTWAYGIAFYLLAMSIVSNIFVGVGTFMNERFVYHASLGFCLVLALLCNYELRITNYEFTNQRSKYLTKYLGIGVLILFAAGCVFRTLEREPDWVSGTTLNRSALKNSPNSARANCFYGVSIWENNYLKIINTGTPEQKQAVLDSMKPYFNRSIEIYPKYNSALKMYAGIAGEQYKLDGKVEPLIAAFDKANRGSYDDYVLKFLGYVNGVVSNRADAEKLAAFYTDMIVFYKQTQATTTLPSEYEKLLNQIRAKKLVL